MNPYRLALASSLFLMACGTRPRTDAGIEDTDLADAGAVQPDAFEDPPDAFAPDAAMVDVGPRDAGPPPGCDVRPVSAVDGTLTTTPDIAWRLTPTGFRFLTMNVTREGSGVALLAEVRNDSTETRCDFSPRVTSGSRPAFSSSMRTAPSFTLGSTITSQCLAPGEVGVLTAFTTGTSFDQVREARILDVQLMPGDLGMPMPARGPFVEGERIVTVPGGVQIEGTLVADLAVQNVFFAAFARDARGVLVAELIGTPGNLEPIPRGARIPFATGTFGCPVTEAESFLSWIVTEP